MLLRSKNTGEPRASEQRRDQEVWEQDHMSNRCCCCAVQQHCCWQDKSRRFKISSKDAVDQQVAAADHAAAQFGSSLKLAASVLATGCSYSVTLDWQVMQGQCMKPALFNAIASHAFKPSRQHQHH
jgi:hypothetical protein